MPTAVAWEMLGRPSRAIETTLERDGTESTVIASRSLGQRERRRLAGALHQLDEHRPRERLEIDPRENPIGERHQPEPEPERPVAVARDQPSPIRASPAAATPCSR